MTGKDLEWLLGFALAESHFGLYPNTNHKPYAHMFIDQEERAPLETLKNALGGIGTKIRKYYSGKGSFVPGTVLYRYQINGMVAEAVYGLFVEQPITWDRIVGFWEGDGTIGFDGPYVRVYFCQKNRKILDEIRAFLGKGWVYKKKSGMHRLEIYDGKKKELSRRLLADVRSPQRRAQLERFV